MPAEGLHPIDLDALAVLIACMVSTPPLSELERVDLYDEVLRFHQPSHELQTHLAPIEGDVGALIEAISRSFSDYLTTGELPPPHYALRLCELLSAAARPDTELAFLEGWSQHFEGRSIGGTYVKLKQRRIDLLHEDQIPNVLEAMGRLNDRRFEVAVSGSSGERERSYWTSP